MYGLPYPWEDPVNKSKSSFQSPSFGQRQVLNAPRQSGKFKDFGKKILLQTVIEA